MSLGNPHVCSSCFGQLVQYIIIPTTKDPPRSSALTCFQELGNLDFQHSGGILSSFYNKIFPNSVRSNVLRIPFQSDNIRSQRTFDALPAGPIFKRQISPVSTSPLKAGFSYSYKRCLSGKLVLMDLGNVFLDSFLLSELWQKYAIVLLNITKKNSEHTETFLYHLLPRGMGSSSCSRGPQNPQQVM